MEKVGTGSIIRREEYGLPLIAMSSREGKWLVCWIASCDDVSHLPWRGRRLYHALILQGYDTSSLSSGQNYAELRSCVDSLSSKDSQGAIIRIMVTPPGTGGGMFAVSVETRTSAVTRLAHWRNAFSYGWVSQLWMSGVCHYEPVCSS